MNESNRNGGGGTPVVMLTTFHRPQPFLHPTFDTRKKRSRHLFLVHKIESNKIVTGKEVGGAVVNDSHLHLDQPLSFSQILELPPHIAR